MLTNASVAINKIIVDLILEKSLEISYLTVIRAVCLSVSEMKDLLKKSDEIKWVENCSEKTDIEFSVANFADCTKDDEIDSERVKLRLDRKNVWIVIDRFEI